MEDLHLQGPKIVCKELTTPEALASPFPDSRAGGQRRAGPARFPPGEAGGSWAPAMPCCSGAAPRVLCAQAQPPPRLLQCAVTGLSLCSSSPEVSVCAAAVAHAVRWAACPQSESARSARPWQRNPSLSAGELTERGL